MDDLPNRRMMMDRARRFLMQQVDLDPQKIMADDSPPRLTIQALEKIRMSRSRERILANVDEMYREAFERAKATGDDAQMAALMRAEAGPGDQKRERKLRRPAGAQHHLKNRRDSIRNRVGERGRRRIGWQIQGKSTLAANGQKLNSGRYVAFEPKIRHNIW